MTQWLIVAAMLLAFAILYYMGDFLGCYHMLTFSDSCEWFANR
jgi:hypothetical protein